MIRFFTLSQLILISLLIIVSPAIADDSDIVLPDNLRRILEVAAKRQDAASFAETVEILLAAQPGDGGSIPISGLIIDIARELKPEAADLLTARPALRTAVVDEVKAPPSVESEIPGNPGLFSLGAWDGSIEAGLSTSSGNTSEQAFALGIEFGRVISDHWDNKIDLDIDYARRAGLTSKERYSGLYQLYYRAWDRAYVYTFLDGERDRFSGFDFRITESAGMGYQIIDSPRQKWNIEGGPGLRQTKLDVGGLENKLIAVLSTDYQFLITPNITFDEKARVFTGEARTTLESESGLKIKFNSSLAARFSFLLKYDSTVPLGSRNTDTLTRATLVYDF